MVGRVYGEPVLRRLLLCCLAGSLLVACGDSSDAAAACLPPQAHPIDPGSSQHVLPGAPEPSYNTNPPTSGAHAPGTYPSGFMTGPVAKPAQVAMLEGGRVLLQFRDDLPAAQLKALKVFGDTDDVVVAPNDSLPAPIVATAWLHSMECQRFDKGALQDFVAMHTGKHEGH